MHRRATCVQFAQQLGIFTSLNGEQKCAKTRMDQHQRERQFIVADVPEVNSGVLESVLLLARHLSSGWKVMNLIQINMLSTSDLWHIRVCVNSRNQFLEVAPWDRCCYLSHLYAPHFSRKMISGTWRHNIGRRFLLLQYWTASMIRSPNIMLITALAQAIIRNPI